MCNVPILNGKVTIRHTRTTAMLTCTYSPTHTHTHTHLRYSTAQQSKVSSEKQRGLCQQSTIHCPEPNLVLGAGHNVSLNNGRKDIRDTKSGASNERARYKTTM